MLRATETAQHAVPKTDGLKYGDVLRITMLGRDGLSVFGEIAQRVTGPGIDHGTPRAQDRAA